MMMDMDDGFGAYAPGSADGLNTNSAYSASGYFIYSVLWTSICKALGKSKGKQCASFGDPRNWLDIYAHTITHMIF